MAHSSIIDISFIIPVSESVDYLRHAISSAISADEYTSEIIVIDDGPTHQSDSFIKNITDEFPQVRWLRHTHAGPGAARNLGISAARGEFVSFLDSDDLVIPLAVKELLRVARTHNSDLVCGLLECFRGWKRWIPLCWRPLTTLSAINTSSIEHPESIRHNSACGKLYRLDFLRTTNLSFPTDVYRGEDWQFSLTALAMSARISFVPRVTYRYRRHATGKQTLSNQVSADLLRDQLTVYDRLNVIWEEKETPLMRYHRDSHFLGSILRYLARFLDSEASLAKKISLLREAQAFALRVSATARADLSARDSIGIELIRVGALLGGEMFLTNGPLPATKQILLLPEVTHDREARESVYRCIKKLRWHPRTLLARARLAREQIRRFTDLIPRLSPTLRLKALIAWILSFIERGCPRRVWIFGERGGYGGDDSSYFFFRWMREHHPESNSYFIVSKKYLARTDPDLRAWILIQGSFQHYRLLYRAAVTVFNFSGMDLALDWKLLGFLGQLPKPLVRVFLNHGVTAIHQVSGHWLFKRMSSHFEEHDIFTVSSEAEKRIFIDKMGHPESTLRVTGITRLDGLSGIQPAHESNKKVLYIPTWRPWLRYGTSDALIGSRFYSEVFQLLHDPDLHALLEESGASLTMLTHHVFQPFVSQLKALGHNRINILDMHSQDAQTHLRDAHLLISDYSSISFDFAYMNKPVLYYQFDQREFYQCRGGFFADPNTELPGKTVTTKDDLFRELRDVIRRGWQMAPEVEQRISKFFAYRDANNCQRVYEGITEMLSTRE
ncbi:MAG: hypothetical protein RL326_1359 [Pseudomonadota bacterium]